MRRTAAAVTITLAAVVMASAALVPWGHLSDQRQRIAESSELLDSLRAETSRLERQAALTDDPVHIERLAREQLSLVRAGDTLYRLRIDPAEAFLPPDRWLLPGVEHLLTGTGP